MSVWSDYHWSNPPAPFNPNFRRGFGEAISKEYTAYCEEHPNSTQEERKAAYKDIAENLESCFPTERERHPERY
ncbi:MAG: hypothetical protein DRO67_00095 [Candidatus Asgardarchaeum californiense]|nr:MAG: hypothetical protein DRO67_00095 [Candidatus Asgardarchaeum californiense]